MTPLEETADAPRGRHCMLHVGLPKTATTSCQNAVWQFRDRLLAEHRILYPALSANHTNALCAAFLEDPRTHVTVRLAGIDTEEGAEAVRQENLAAIEAELARPGWDTVIFSAEGLSNLTTKAHRGLFAWLKGHVDSWTVVFWTRHPLSYTTSVMQQMIKGGHTLEQMADRLPLPRFQGRISNLFRVYGRETVRIRAFEDAIRVPGGPVAAFCQDLDLPETLSAEITAAAEVENESLSSMATYLLDSLNRQRPIIVDGKRNPQRRYGELHFIQRIGGGKFRLPDSVNAKIAAQSKPDVLWMNETLGTERYTDILALADDDGPVEITYPFPREIVDSLARVLSDLMNRIYKE